MRLTLACRVAALLLCLTAPAVGAQGRPTFTNPSDLPTPRGYSQVVDVPAGNRLILLSGQVPLDSADQLVGANDIRAQTVQVFENLRRGLASRGATFNDVIKVTYYVTDVRASLAVIREVRARYLNQQAPPASTLVQVGALFRPDIAIEIEVMAVLPR